MPTHTKRTSKAKKILSIGASPHDYKKALSDLAGIDGKSHSNKPEKAVMALRNWFMDTVHMKNAASPTVIWYKFTDFTADFYEQRKDEGFSKGDLKMMPLGEYVAFIRKWVNNNK